MPPHENCNWEHDKGKVVEQMDRIERSLGELRTDMPRWFCAIAVSMFIMGALTVIVVDRHMDRDTGTGASASALAVQTPDSDLSPELRPAADTQLALDW